MKIRKFILSSFMIFMMALMMSSIVMTAEASCGVYTGWSRKVKNNTKYTTTTQLLKKASKVSTVKTARTIKKVPSSRTLADGRLRIVTKTITTTKKFTYKKGSKVVKVVTKTQTKTETKTQKKCAKKTVIKRRTSASKIRVSEGSDCIEDYDNCYASDVTEFDRRFSCFNDMKGYIPEYLILEEFQTCV